MFSSRHVALAVFFAATTLRCVSTDPSPTDSTAAPASAKQWEPVAGYLGSDDATGTKIAELLKARGIESVAAGSLGYTVNVAAGDAARAREILRAAVADKTLSAVTIYEAKDLQAQ